MPSSPGRQKFPDSPQQRSLKAPSCMGQQKLIANFVARTKGFVLPSLIEFSILLQNFFAECCGSFGPIDKHCLCSRDAIWWRTCQSLFARLDFTTRGTRRKIPRHRVIGVEKKSSFFEGVDKLKKASKRAGTPCFTTQREASWCSNASDALISAAMVTHQIEDTIHDIIASSQRPRSKAGKLYAFKIPRRRRRAWTEVKSGCSIHPRKRRKQWERKCRGQRHQWWFYRDVPDATKFGSYQNHASFAGLGTRRILTMSGAIIRVVEYYLGCLNWPVVSIQAEVQASQASHSALGVLETSLPRRDRHSQHKIDLKQIVVPEIGRPRTT
ncbi:hypothetical protein C8R44DRAFT_744717 [Mycena epipterygia]|nr:hypothetical protein C8R44DRAFT_744717 [Mycena epipterygia]